MKKISVQINMDAKKNSNKISEINVQIDPDIFDGLHKNYYDCLFGQKKCPQKNSDRFRHF